MAGVDPSFGKSRTYTIVKASLPKKKLQNAMAKGLGAAGLWDLHFLIFAIYGPLFRVGAEPTHFKTLMLGKIEGRRRRG